MEKKITLASESIASLVFGPADEYLRQIRKAFDVRISARGEEVKISGDSDNCAKAAKVVERLEKAGQKRKGISPEEARNIITQVSKTDLDPSAYSIEVYSHKSVVEPFTDGQADYLKQMLENDLTFCTGPAGTGKTYLAVAMAVSMLKKQQIRKIVLVRPAVEAGEKLGFLPGDIEAKVNPYLRPLFDSLEDLMEYGQMRKLMSLDVIEIIPLAFMRGRTLNEAVVICDEAQNTTPSQMMMFLTRLGRDSKMIVTGDLTQVDLEARNKSGLSDAIETLSDVHGVGCCELSRNDIVRHNLVQNIVKAYERRKEKLVEKVKREGMI
ncbi:PhoH-like protein [Sedimentisphaera cyanobacteriorum]|uniref:PhoH-like protein n=1 Tax=Sedimentisphaera cyanobacteriorum TaxID=1940790 RepID=A0A1Q2HP79_9BACT|nr:PhoH family protein [Sedimentisphaera cyanobacteriorum]AQQ09259.1 PhoH-like protein [Sedimentisphaera cyanobacteriorum]